MTFSRKEVIFPPQQAHLPPRSSSSISTTSHSHSQSINSTTTNDLYNHHRTPSLFTKWTSSRHRQQSNTSSSSIIPAEVRTIAEPRSYSPPPYHLSELLCAICLRDIHRKEA